MSTGIVAGVMLPERGFPAPSDVVTVPAVVSFRGGKVAVGEPALMMAAVVPDAILPGPLRLLGRKADDPLVRRYAERFSLEATLTKGELRWIPEEEPKDPGLGAIQAMTALFDHVLEMLDRARERHAVVAVPPWLGDAGRSQLVRAATNAQITVRRFVTRPVAIALSLAADRQLLGRGVVVTAGAGGVAAALVEGRSRSLSVEEIAARDTAGADDVAAEIVRSITPSGARRQARELLRQGADAMIRTLADSPLAERSIDTPDGPVRMRLEQWELDLLMGPTAHDLAVVLNATKSGTRRLPTWFSGSLSGHRVLRATASEKAQGPLRHVDEVAAALGAARVAAMVEGRNAELELDDGESLLAPTGRAARTSERGNVPAAPPEAVVSGPETRRKQDTYRPPTNMSVKEVSTKRARASTRRLSPEERAKRRRERSLKVREAQKGPLPTRGSLDADASAPADEASPSEPGSNPTATEAPPGRSETPRPGSEARRTSTPPPDSSPPHDGTGSAPAPEARSASTPPEPPAAVEPLEPPAAPKLSPPPHTGVPRADDERPEDATPKPSSTPPARPRTPTEPARPQVQDEASAPVEHGASRRMVTEPGIAAARPTSDVPASTSTPSHASGGRPVMSARNPSGRRPTAPQISLDRETDPGEAPRADSITATEPSMQRLSQPPRMSTAPPRISELPPERSSIKSPDSSSPRPSVPPGGRLSLPPGAVWPQAGALKNPRDAFGVLDMAIIRELREEDLEPAALPVLLRRIIGRANMVGTFKLQAGRTEVEVPVQDGCLLIARAEHNALRRAFDEPEGTWSFKAGRPIDVAKHPLSELKKLRTLGLEGLRRMLRHTEPSDLQATFGHRYDEAPTIHPHKVKHPRRLRLDRREVRAVEQNVDGKATVRTLTNTSGLGSRNTLQVLALLDMFEVLRWPEGDAL